MNKLISFQNTGIYVTYTKGTEDSITITATVSPNNTDEYTLMLPDNVTPFSLSIASDTKSMYWVQLPNKTTNVKYSVEYVNLDKTDTRTFNGDGVTTSFSDTLYTIVQEGTVNVAYTIGAVAYTATDSGGTITGTDLTGTIDYNTGALSLTFSVAPDDATTITVGYTYAKKGEVDIK